MNQDVLFASGSDEWSTPQAFYDRLDAEFHFSLDAAASAANAKHARWFGPTHPHAARRDALMVSWWQGRSGEAVFCNPPYSRGLQGKFIAKAAEEGAGGLVTVVLLLPARTDTRAFHRYIYDAATWSARPGVEIRFLPGRLTFGGAANSAPFPSMVVIMRQVEVFAWR